LNRAPSTTSWSKRQIPTVKIHLENPFLGSGCYVGSSSSPLTWNLTTGTTAPPPPNTPITGKAGFVEFLEEGRIAVSKEAVLVDNAWSAPASPPQRGRNAAILKNELNIASAAAVRKNNAENPSPPKGQAVGPSAGARAPALLFVDGKLRRSLP
jgi:hypothetical protein